MFMNNEDYVTPKEKKRHHTDHLAFFDEPVQMQRYDEVRHPWVEKFNDTQLSFFWRPEEVNVTKDRADYESLTEAGKFIFTSNLQRQILLDTVQGREPLKVFLPMASSPEMEAACVIWPFSELIHSRSYTHIIRGVTNNPSEIFDTVLEIPQITELSDELNRYYDDTIEWNFKKEAKDRGYDLGYDSRAHKKSMYMSFISANALEAIRFYVSFACSFAFMEQPKPVMEGNSKIIRLIARDEALHLTFTQRNINRTIKEDPEWVEVVEECKDEALQLFLKVVQQEKDWADYIFQKGSLLGLDAEICKDYIDWLASKRLGAIGMEYPYEVPASNPLPWMDGWLTSSNKQTALQEAENDSYLLGAVGGCDTEARTAVQELINKFKY